MRHIACIFMVIVLLTGTLVAPTGAQTDDPPLITIDSDGVYMTQTTLDDTPTTLPGQLIDSGYYSKLSVDRRYATQTIVAPEYDALPDDEKATMNTLPTDIVVINLQTGDVLPIAEQAANVPDVPWLYRSNPVWSPNTNQFAFVEASDSDGLVLKLYDVDTQTLTAFSGRLPMGYSDAGMIGWPTPHWAEVGIYSIASNIAPDRMGFAQTLTVIDPTGQQPVQSVVAGRTLSGGHRSKDTVLAVIPAVDTDGEPILLLATAYGEWFIPDMAGYGRRWQTLILRPGEESDIEIQFAQTTTLEPSRYQRAPAYRAFIRRGDGIFEPLNPTSRYSIHNLTSPSGLIAAPDGSSILYRTTEGTYQQWFGADDIHEIDLGGRTIVTWGDWVVEAQRNSYVRPYLTVIDGPPTVRVIHVEPVNLYVAPSTEADVLDLLQPGTTFRVITGPLYDDFAHWYEIIMDDDRTGWIELGSNEDRWFAD